MLFRLLPLLSLMDIDPVVIFTFKLLEPSKVKPSKSVWIVSNLVLVDCNVVSVAKPLMVLTVTVPLTGWVAG